jgi:peptide deformylase
MQLDSQVSPAEIVKIGHPALRHGTRVVSQELFDTPPLYE